MAYRDEENDSSEDEDEVENENKSSASENESGDENWAVKLFFILRFILLTTYATSVPKKNIILLRFLIKLFTVFSCRTKIN